MQRPASICNEEEWRKACKHIVSTAQAILRSELGIIEGARKLCGYRLKVKAEKDADFIFFVGVDSETDDLPIGDAQAHWSQTALARKREEIVRCEDFYKERAFQACNNLIAKYQAKERISDPNSK